MSRWLALVAAGFLILVACASENEPAPNVDSAADAAATNADATQRLASHDPASSASSESSELAKPAAEGLPEVRYYSLGGT